MATDNLEPVIQAKLATESAPPAPQIAPATPLSPTNSANVEKLTRPPLDPATLSFRSLRKELITVFVETTNLNLPNLPQTFFQSIFKGKKPDSALAECRIEVDLKLAGENAAIVYHQTTEALRSRNLSFSVGLTIPVPLAKANCDEYHLYFRVVQTDEGFEKTVATAEMMCLMLLESFKQGAPVMHLPLHMTSNHEAIMSLTFARAFPIKHNIMPVQNTLMHMYAFSSTKEKKEEATLLASEELVEVGYASSIPPIFLAQCCLELEAAHRLWNVRYNNARKSALLFESQEEALANGCDVYSVEIIRARGLSLPADLSLQPQPSSPANGGRPRSASTGRPRSGSNPSKPQAAITCNPFVAIKFRESSKGTRPIEVSEGKTSIEKNTGEPHWSSDGKPSKPIVFYRPNQSGRTVKRTLEIDVMSECASHFDGEIPLGNVAIPIDAVMYEGMNATYSINLTNWLPIKTDTGEERGEILIHLQMRRATTVFSLDPEPSLAPGSLFHLADPKRHTKWVSNMEAKEYSPPQSIAEIQNIVVAHKNALDQVNGWLDYAEKNTAEWFRSSEWKVKNEVQSKATNLHVSYFRIYKGQDRARETVLEGRPRDVEVNVLPGEQLELTASLRKLIGNRGSRFSLEDLIDHDSPLEVKATYSTVTCGAPTAHALGLSQFGLVELEDKLLSVDAPLELNRCTYALRKSVCMSQALSALVATFMSQLELALQNGGWMLEQWMAVGFLIGWESLVSTQGKELHMLSDSWVAIKSLERVKIQLVAHSELMTFTAADTGYILQLPLPAAAFSQLPQPLQDGQLISITAVLFTQGINEMQTLANVVGAIGIALQVRINVKCCAVLREYHERLMAAPSLAGMTAQMKAMKLDTLSALIANSNETTMTKKNHRILLEASDDIRRLNGGRVTFCKSGKDRTAMSVTLDQARIVGSLWKEGAPLLIHDQGQNVDWTLLKPVANLMREFGVRIEVAKKNVGQLRYSFNSLQRKMLPKMYRPPRSAIIKGDHEVDDS
ncbi:unnamed protein product [Aphanomyces euteiches]